MTRFFSIHFKINQVPHSFYNQSICFFHFFTRIVFFIETGDGAGVGKGLNHLFLIFLGKSDCFLNLICQSRFKFSIQREQII